MWLRILEILQIPLEQFNMEWNSATWGEVEEKKKKLIGLLGNEDKANEVINFAMIGELSLIRYKYLCWTRVL